MPAPRRTGRAVRKRALLPRAHCTTRALPTYALQGGEEEEAEGREVHFVVNLQNENGDHRDHEVVDGSGTDA